MLRTQVEFATWEPSLKVCLRPGEARQPGSRQTCRGLMCGSGAALRGQARRARGAHAPHTLRLSSSSMAPSARTWFPVCARPAQAAAPRTPSRAAPQPAAACKRLLPLTACSADARGPGPLESARKSTRVGKKSSVVGRGTAPRWNQVAAATAALLEMSVSTVARAKADSAPKSKPT